MLKNRLGSWTMSSNFPVASLHLQNEFVYGGGSNRRPLDCLTFVSYALGLGKSSLCNTELLWGNPVTSGFPLQLASNVEKHFPPMTSLWVLEIMFLTLVDLCAWYNVGYLCMYTNMVEYVYTYRLNQVLTTLICRGHSTGSSKLKWWHCMPRL